MERLLGLCGNPHKQLKTVLIAGTKGKGSTAAILESILRASSYRVGLYTSPHLEDVRERIQINRTCISKTDFSNSVEFFKNKIHSTFKKNEEPTYFELLTAIGFKYFDDQKIDIAVVEVGMGGRLDATNVLTPLISILTPISFDHQAFLGKKLEHIAREKSAIIKKNGWVVCASQDKAAMQAIAKRIRLKTAKLWLENYHYKVTHKTISSPDTSFQFQAIPCRVHLMGHHQAQNASMAIQAALLLKRRNWNKISWRSIQKGLCRVHWPVRFQQVVKNKKTWILDGAHNGDSSERLAATVRTLFKPPVGLVIGGSEDKDWPRIFKHLSGLSKRAILTQSNHPKAMEAKKLSRSAQSFFKSVTVTHSLKEALKLVKNEVGLNPIVVTGSLFVAQEARKELISHDTRS